MATTTERIAVIVDANTGSAVTAINKLGTATARASVESQHLADRHEDSSRRISRASAIAAGAMKGLGLATAGLALAGGAAVATFGKSVLQIGVQFQDQLNTLQAVSHATSAEMIQVGKTARDLGNDLTLPATSAADAAEAMTELAKGNLDVKEAQEAAKGTLQLAAAAQVSGAQAAQIQANALNAFNLEATKAGHVADVLANASNAASGEITDFALGLQASSTVASQFGISLDDTVTALALFAGSGIKGSDAGTSLKASLLALASPSKQAREALHTLGVDAFDAKGKFVGLEEISRQLAKAQGKLSQEAFAAAVSTAFGSDAARAAGILATNGAEGFDKMALAVGRAGGAADVAAAKTKGVGGAIQGLESQVETVKIDVFTREAPALEKFIRALSDRLPGAASAALDSLDSLTQTGGEVFDFVKGKVEEFGPAVDSFLAAKAETAGRAFNEVLKPALQGVGDILAEILPHLSSAADSLGEVFNSALTAAGKVAQNFADSSKSIGGTLGDVADQASHVADDVLPTLTGALSVAGTATGGLVQALGGAATILSPFAGTILAGVVAVKGMQLAIGGLSAAPGQVGRVRDAFNSLGERVAKVAGTVALNTQLAFGAGLGTATKSAETAMTRTRSAVTALGAAAPVVGIGLLGIGYALEQSAEDARRNIATFTELYGAFHIGGDAASAARIHLDSLSDGIQRLKDAGSIGGTIGGQLADEMNKGSAAARAEYDSLSVLQQRSVDVTEAQTTLTAAVRDYHSGSPQVIAATDAYQQALQRQKETQDQVADSAKTQAQLTQEAAQAARDAAGATLSLQQAELGIKQAYSSNETAVSAYRDAVSHYGVASKQARDAGLQVAQTEIGIRQAYLNAADAARRHAEATDKSGDAAIRSAAGDAAYREELRKLAAKVSPGSELRRYLQGLIGDLDNAGKSRTSVLTILTRQGSFTSASGNTRKNTPNVRARGGPVTAGEAYVVGERQAELFIPDQNGYVYPTVGSGARGLSVPASAPMGNTVYITLNIPAGAHPADVGAGYVKAIREYEKRSGTSWRAA